MHSEMLASNGFSYPLYYFSAHAASVMSSIPPLQRVNSAARTVHPHYFKYMGVQCVGC